VASPEGPQQPPPPGVVAAPEFDDLNSTIATFVWAAGMAWGAAREALVAAGPIAAGLVLCGWEPPSWAGFGLLVWGTRILVRTVV